MYAFPTEYYRYLHYRRAVLRCGINAFIGVLTVAVVVTIAWLYLHLTGYLDN